jgi:exonuclease III
VNKAQADEHLQVVARKLVSINADIITLVEVLDCRVLQCLIDAMGDSSYKPYLIPGMDTATDQNVGIISRIDPITALTRDEQRATVYRSESNCGSNLEDSYNSGVSKHFIARFNVAGLGPISLIGAHLLAFPTTPDRCIRRECQATVLRNIAQNERNSGRQVVILGDLNDYDRDILDTSDSVPTSRVSNLLKYDESTQIMINVVERVLQKSIRYSSWWDQNNDCMVQPGELTLIDHLLLSPVLNQRVISVHLYNNVLEECDTLESDHYPIKVVLATPNVEIVEDQANSEQDSEAQVNLSQLGIPEILTISFVILGVVLLGIGVVFFLLKRQQKSINPTYGTFNE